MKRTIVLVVLDGWGIGSSDDSNPIHVVNPKKLNYLRDNFPYGLLQASGISVGLPWGEEGNSEVGHLNLGAGKIFYQHYPRISISIRDESFFKNKTLEDALEHAQKYSSDVNIVGLLSEGNVHASFEHLTALIDFFQQKKVRKINLHFFTDGRDSPPNSVRALLGRLPKSDNIVLASIGGRFFGMDREKHWDRVQKGYSVLVGDGPAAENVNEHVKKTYEQKITDEFIEPVRIGSPDSAIKDNDAVIFFNFREDRMKQIAAAFINKNFNNFPAKAFNNIYLATMTQYDDSFGAPVIFMPDKIETPLGKVLADNNKIQLRISETQKYPHITYFFNGMKDEPFKDEYRILIPSKTVVHQENQPEMMAPEITSRVIQSIGEGAYDFILINYANPDMIAHTANYKACIKAVEVINEQIGKITEAVLECDAVLIITSDHGNIEKIMDPLTGEPETQHNISPVPFYLVARSFKRKKTPEEIREASGNIMGILADVAPTILELMDLPKPAEMTGQSLLKFLLE
jgi:2,3-bisphosphoglycerate-independent phosphoglycerate mutase